MISPSRPREIIEEHSLEDLLALSTKEPESSSHLTSSTLFNQKQRTFTSSLDEQMSISPETRVATPVLSVYLISPTYDNTQLFHLISSTYNNT